jgi:hypothetical protein
LSFTAYDISNIRTNGAITTVEAKGVDEYGSLIVRVGSGRGGPVRLVDSDKWFRTREEAFTRVMERLEAAITKKQTELNELLDMRTKIHFDEDNATQGGE